VSVSVKITGIEQFKYNLRQLTEKQRRRLKMALDSVLIEIVNWIKDNHFMLGGWIDRTGNLNNSISYTSSQWEGDTLKGIVFAGMEYAVYVEFKEGHWVLSGGFNEFRDKILDLLRTRAGF
jgi:hypothetical protein